MADDREPETGGAAAAGEKNPGTVPGPAGSGEQSNPAPPLDILPPQHWVQAAQDNASDDDGDSALGEDAASSTASITSTILNYRTIHGRTFHSETGNAQYWGSNDDKKNESMDIGHHLMTLTMDGKLYRAPLKKNIKKALDIGTGTGIWAIDFADEYPDTEVIGTDVSPIQPGWVPPNLKFEIEDCTRPWTFRPDCMDYVHIRLLVGSVIDWTELFREAYKVLKPGGYLESYEASPAMESDDGTVDDKSAMHQWGKFFIEGGRKLGRTFTVIDDKVQRKAMEEAGFVDIEEWDCKVPIGGWAQDPKLKEIGQYAQLSLEQDSEGWVLFMANVMVGWSKEEIQVYTTQLRREIRSGKKHAFYRQRVVWGRKPE
ncbi:S-adenosyl-L-methionine-dependent methyltransferase [Phialemonium atrogriseum]|uniref:S-adenosyl-L-methionine-dependent methyltransferase n=1 Tax=Phialemonium atrogriseum TaxID=1093897 RepID=A0AAJ0FCK4_9PEZI|nr:S-adenosyl-L-methionine-dependent methyltransferase [Phialemonium atrogriseum]KAK1763691.1 S-adenosyl-L-methionine-dependent methyltransferase [Phialemonium atrogriseum]